MELSKHHVIDIGGKGYTAKFEEVNNVLIQPQNHGTGLFSCSSVALESLLIYFNTHKQLPDEFDRSASYMFYKNKPWDNLIPMLFKETDDEIPFTEPVEIVNENVWFQWSDYKNVNFAGLKPFIDKYFAPSDAVMDRVIQLERDYQIDYENTVGILYRGNDKVKECSIGGYEGFSNKAVEVVKEDFGFKYKEDRIPTILVSPDETEFYEYMKKVWDTCFISPTQWLHMPKDSNTAIFMHLPQNERPEHAINVLAMVVMLSKCKHLITHTGNMSFWCCLYRGNMDNVHQWREGQWL